MSAIRKQLQWDDSVDIWPITDTSAIHYTYNPGSASRVTAPVSGTSYGLDNFLNGLTDKFLSRDEVVAIATNVNKGPGILYNSASNTTNVSTPTLGTANFFIKCNYNNSGVFSVSFDSTSYLASTTNYAISSSVGGDAVRAVDITGGAKGNILYLNAANDTAFLANPASSSYVLGWDSTNDLPAWVLAENSTTLTLGTNLSVSLRDGSWEPASSPFISLPTDKGVYALYIELKDGSLNAIGTYAGVFSINGNSGKLEEIPLHWDTAATTTEDSSRIYAATKEGKLVLSSNNTNATSYLVTIKCKRLI